MMTGRGRNVGEISGDFSTIDRDRVIYRYRYRVIERGFEMKFNKLRSWKPTAKVLDKALAATAAENRRLRNELELLNRYTAQLEETQLELRKELEAYKVNEDGRGNFGCINGFGLVVCREDSYCSYGEKGLC